MSMPLLRKLCEQHQIVVLGVLPCEESDAYPYFLRWLQEGQHGTMQFLERHGPVRQNPALLEPSMQRMIVCAYVYGQKPSTPLYAHGPSSGPRIAQYARLQDYHPALRKLGSQVMEAYRPHARSQSYVYRVVVDSAPVLEKALAVTTGAGFQGKNTLFIHPQLGSFTFLFEIFTSENFPLTLKHPTEPWTSPLRSSCGSCRRCQVHCPTQALDHDYVLDARRCLAYYSIEHRQLIPVRYWPHFAQYYFGCDICQLVCPFNRWAQASHALRQRVSPEIPLAEIALMDQHRYEELFGGSAMTRAKRSGLRRNALIAMVATKDAALSSVLATLSAEKDLLLLGTIRQIPAFYRWQSFQHKRRWKRHKR